MTAAEAPAWQPGRVGLNETKGRDDYFAAGFEILAGQGPEALTIAELCTRLGVTKGSF
jgi:AcrR family transcriptional regulator